LEREEGGKEFVAPLIALSKFARKTVLKINWSVKTRVKSAWNLLAPGYGLLGSVNTAL